MARLGESSHGYLSDITQAVAPHLPQETLARWDSDLAGAIEERKAREAKRSSDRWFYSMTSQWGEMRQTIASARGDLDLIIALEEEKHLHMQDTLGIASRLLDAERAAEALDWVRRPGQRTFDGSGNEFIRKAFSAILDRQIGQIDVDREPWQISIEQIYGGAAFEGEHLFHRYKR